MRSADEKRAAARTSRRRPGRRHRAHRQSTAAQPNFAPAWFLAASCAFSRGEPESAIEHIEHAARLEPVGPGNVSDAGRNGTRAFLRRPFRFRPRLGGKGAGEPAQPAGSRRPGGGEPLPSPGPTEEAQRAMPAPAPARPSLRLSDLQDWLPIHRPEDLARFRRNDWRLAGLPE